MGCKRVRRPSFETRPAGAPQDEAERRPTLIRILVENRLDRALPLPAILFEQLFGRRDAARHDLLQRPQVTRLVAAVAVEPLAADQSLLGETQQLQGDVEQRLMADRRAKAEPRHVIAQFL